jgi:uncharacterized membrane protein (DUF4010 family)
MPTERNLESRRNRPALDAQERNVMENFFTALLVVMFIAVVWFAGYVVLKLFKGQS